MAAGRQPAEERPAHRRQPAEGCLAPPYPREVGGALAQHGGAVKYWPPVGRVDNVYGDRNLFCSCLPIEELA